MALRILLKNRHLALMGVLILAAVAIRMAIGATGTTPINPGHPLSQTWIDTDLNMSNYNIYTSSGNISVGASNVYKRGTASGTTVSCLAGQYLQSAAVSGGIITGGTCIGPPVTSVSAGTGLSGIPNPITATGTLSLDTAGIGACTNPTTSKIYWDSANSRLICGTDQSGGGWVDDAVNNIIYPANIARKVGIGTQVSPNYLFTVNGGAKVTTLQIGDSPVFVGGNYPEFRISEIAGTTYSSLISGTSAIWRNTSGVKSTVFASGGSIPMVMRDDGKVGINISTPSEALEVRGNLKISGAGNGVIFPDGSKQTIAAAGGSVPAGAVMFFNLASCPAGWAELTSARGRYIVGLPLGGTLAGTDGTALSDLEDRPTGQHSHTFSVRSEGGGAGLGDPTYNNPGAVMATPSTSSAGSVAGTNAPYIQLLACQKL